MSATVDSLPADRPSSSGEPSGTLSSGTAPPPVGPPVVAVVGGGQLARMMAPAAGELGIRLRVLVEDPASSAAQVVTDAPVGVASDEAAIRSLIAPSDGVRRRRC